MSDITVTQKTQRIIVNPQNGSVSIVNAGPTGPTGAQGAPGEVSAAQLALKEDKTVVSAVSIKNMISDNVDKFVSWDSFNRTNGVLGVSDSGHTWSTLVGTFTISGNQVAKTGAGTGLVVITGVGNGVVGCNVLETNSHLAFRIIDSTNFLFARIFSDGRVDIYKSVADVSTLLVSSKRTVTHTLFNRLEVTLIDDIISVSVNGEYVVSYQMSAAEYILFPNTLTTCGFRTSSNAARWDNFYTSVVPFVVPVLYYSTGQVLANGVEVGDTGWRKIDIADILSGWSYDSGGFLAVRRIGNQVFISAYNLRGTAATALDIYLLTAGFRSQYNSRSQVIGTTVTELRMLATGMLSANSFGGTSFIGSSYVSYLAPFITNNQWPTVLPGTALP